MSERGPITVRTDLWVCGQCDAVYRRRRLRAVEAARCFRCGATLARGQRIALDGQAALAIAAAIVLVIACASPLVALELGGRKSEASVFGASRLTWIEGEHLVAVLVLATAFVFPLTVILLRLSVLLTILARRIRGDSAPQPTIVWRLRALRRFTRWSMVEVFMVGIVIALAKSEGHTDVVLGPGLAAYVALTALLAALHATGLEALWSRAGLSVPATPRSILPREVRSRDQAPPRDASTPVSAASLNVYGCECCGLVVEGGVERCPRCRGPLYRVKPDSLQRAWAFLATALVLFVPANVLPVMVSRDLRGHDSHTLSGGIQALWASGSRGLAAIVLFASVVVPVAKVAALALLAWTAGRRSTTRRSERAALYRMVETVGHWSMLDVFVVVLLVGMVQLGPLAGVEPEAGILAFGAVVVATMLAASSFDPRLIWSEAQEP
jgi:paraquat-inducible protein A